MKKSILVLGLAAVTTAAVSGAALATDPLYFLNHNDLPTSGNITTWDGASAIGAPNVETINGQKWARNYAVDPVGATPGAWTGFKVAEPTTAIPVNGATFMLAVNRIESTLGNPWTTIVDVMYDKLTLGIQNNTGKIVVRRNGAQDFSEATIAAGQNTILTLTCQADGSYEVWANGVSVLSRGANGTMTEWDPNRIVHYDDPDWTATTGKPGDWNAWWDYLMTVQPTITGRNDWTNWWKLDATTRDQYWGFEAPCQDFKRAIHIGRNKYDNWAAFNGLIGDVKIWGVALDPTARLAEEANMSSAMGLGAPVPEPASILAMLTGLAGFGGFAIRRKRA